MAFGLGSKFNYESDILLWDPSYKFNYDNLSRGNLPPIICDKLDGEIERSYINNFWNNFHNGFKDLIELKK